VRLVNGSSRCAGRVEVLHRGQWGTVCGAGWDLADAAVVCRELDCGEPVDALGDAHFGPGSGPFRMKNAVCAGSESTLKKCGFIRPTDLDVCLNKSAQVICSGKIKIKILSKMYKLISPKTVMNTIFMTILQLLFCNTNCYGPTVIIRDLVKITFRSLFLTLF